jgi:hypothetical protein
MRGAASAPDGAEALGRCKRDIGANQLRCGYLTLVDGDVAQTADREAQSGQSERHQRAGRRRCEPQPDTADDLIEHVDAAIDVAAEQQLARCAALQIESLGARRTLQSREVRARGVGATSRVGECVTVRDV